MPKGFHDTPKKNIKVMSKASKLKRKVDDAQQRVNTGMKHACVIGNTALSRETFSTVLKTEQK